MEHTLGVMLTIAACSWAMVLILVLMEHTLGDMIGERNTIKVFGVLILVLMEHTLGGSLGSSLHRALCVLILVLMEHTLGVYTTNATLTMAK